MSTKISRLLQSVVCIYFLISVSVCGDDPMQEQPVQEKKITKRYDMDLKTCIENFDVHKDKIIRTQDSRAMGAKYINEIDSGSREECLRMCCETSTCDVFVFEEKTPGSCYLFHCGAPDDFKCKFTKHHNYTSAVLAVNRHITDLEDQIRHTKHEQELTQLRKPDAGSVQNTAASVPATPAVVTSIPLKEPAQIIQAVNSSTQGRACSRYQFECRSSGECIAIYNACDGIPQCSDGSDEAPELDCPAPGTTPPPAPATPPAAAKPQQHQYEPHSASLEQHVAPQSQDPRALPAPPLPVSRGSEAQIASPAQQAYGPQHYHPAQQQGPWRPQGAQQMGPPAAAQAQQYPGAQPQQQARGKLYGREGEGPGQGYGAPTGMQWSNYQQQPGPYHAPMAQFPAAASHEYEDQNSHIFTHKGNGLVADSDRYNSKGMHPSRYNSAAQYSEVPHNEYNKFGGSAPNNYYNNGQYRQPVPNNWQQQSQPQAHDPSSIQGLEDLSRLRKLPPEDSYIPPIPPDYYYEDSQEARFHPPPAHEQELVQHAPVPHGAAAPPPGERESIADGATPIQPIKHHQQHQGQSHQHHHKNQTPLEIKLEKEIEPPQRKGTIEVHVQEPEPKKAADATTVKPVARKVNHEQHKTAHLRKRPEPEVSLEETGIVIEPIDSEVGKPSGAILSLALGLVILVIMVILVACRLRVVRKRLRRGGKSPYAHDADYLVNGMYL